MLIRRWLPYPSWKDLDDKNDQLFTIRYEAAVTPSRTPPGQAFLTLAFPNEEAIILRDVSNGRGTMNPVTTFCPGWWLKANDPPPSFLPFALVLPSLLSLNLPPSFLSPLFRSEFNSRREGSLIFNGFDLYLSIFESQKVEWVLLELGRN